MSSLHKCPTILLQCANHDLLKGRMIPDTGKKSLGLLFKTYAYQSHNPMCELTWSKSQQIVSLRICQAGCLLHVIRLYYMRFHMDFICSLSAK